MCVSRRIQVYVSYNIVSQRDLQDAARKLEGYLAAQKGENSGQIGQKQEKEAVAKSHVIN